MLTLGKIKPNRSTKDLTTLPRRAKVGDQRQDISQSLGVYRQAEALTLIPCRPAATTIQALRARLLDQRSLRNIDTIVDVSAFGPWQFWPTASSLHGGNDVENNSFA
jgi:hypothetical protein